MKESLGNKFFHAIYDYFQSKKMLLIFDDFDEIFEYKNVKYAE